MFIPVSADREGNTFIVSLEPGSSHKVFCRVIDSAFWLHRLKIADGDNLGSSCGVGGSVIAFYRVTTPEGGSRVCRNFLQFLLR